MPTNRLVTILELLAEREGSGHHGGMLCSVAAQITDLNGAAIALVSAGNQLTSFCASNEVASALMDLEVTVGEGPSVDACWSQRVVAEDDLTRVSGWRWMAYAPEAVSLGAEAVYGFPVRIGAVRLGALALFRDYPGPLRDEQERDAYLMASVVARAILSLQARAVQGSMAAELEGEATFDFRVHQAAGMIAVQSSMGLGDALVLLRSHAFATGCALGDIAGRVVARELH